MHHTLNQNITQQNKSNSTERYLITYADLLTLLFALFIILYAMSKPDGDKMQELMKAMNNIFNPNQIIEGNNLSPDVPTQIEAPVIIFPAKPLTIPELQEQVENKLSTLIENKTLNFEKIPEGIKLTVPNKFLFTSANATLLRESYEVLDNIALAIAELDMQIQIDGHSDAIPIKTFAYASNWELSAARSVNVVQALIDRGVPSHNLVVRAFGEQRPIADNTTEEGREKNRRVEIIITQKDIGAAITSTVDFAIEEQ